MAKNGGWFWTSGLGLLLLVLLAVLAVPTAGAFALIYSITHPQRDKQVVDPSDFLLPAEEVTFSSTDGVPLSGWFVRGRPGGTVILLCHDLGSSRASLMNAAVALNRAAYPLLLFDFRRHGKSGGSTSTLGVEERQDILGALAYLRTRKDIDAGRFGIWGVGMGAYAAVLAALEDKSLAALALDSLYPDVPTHLDRLVREKVPPALDRVVPAVHLLYDSYLGKRLQGFSVRGRVHDLAGRNILFIAGADSPERAQEERDLYDALPEGPEGDKNLLQLKVSGVSGLYAEDRKKYDETLVAFFARYLSPESGRRDQRKQAIEVLEK